MDESLAKSTRKQYETALQRCLSFLREQLGVTATLPLSQHQLHLYIANMYSNKYKHSTIMTHISAISHFHKLHNLPDPATTYATTKILNGVRNVQDIIPDTRLPITRQILQGLLTVIKFCTVDRYQQQLFRSIFTLMYYACLRASEVILTETPEHIIQWSQITFSSDRKSFQLQFKSYKHSKDNNFKLKVTSTSSIDCPVENMNSYIAVRGHRPGPLYQVQNKPLTRQQFTTTLNQCLKYINLPYTQFNTHSFRIGRTTDMATANVPHTTIKRIGRWKSNAFMKYVRPVITSTVP